MFQGLLKNWFSQRAQNQSQSSCSREGFLSVAASPLLLLLAAVIAMAPAQAQSETGGLEGTPTVGQILRLDTSEIRDPDGLGPFHYQWQRSDDPDFQGVATDITGATGTSYTLAEEDASGYIRAVVSFTDGRGHDESLPSNITAQVGPAVFTSDMIQFATAVADMSMAMAFTQALETQMDAPINGLFVDGQAAGNRLRSVLQALMPSQCSNPGTGVGLHERLLSGTSASSPCGSLDRKDLAQRLRERSEVGEIAFGLSGQESGMSMWMHAKTFDVSGASSLEGDLAMNHGEGGLLAYIGMSLQATERFKYGFTFGLSDVIMEDVALLNGGTNNDSMERNLLFASSFVDYRLGSQQNYRFRMIVGVGSGETIFRVQDDESDKYANGVANSELTFYTLNFGREFRLGALSSLTPAIQVTNSSGWTDSLILYGTTGALYVPSTESSATEFSLKVDASFGFLSGQRLTLGSSLRSGRGDLQYSGVGDITVRYQGNRLKAELRQQLTQGESENNAYSLEYLLVKPKIGGRSSFDLVMGADYSRTENFGSLQSTGPLNLGYVSRFNYKFGKASAGSLGGRLRLDQSGGVSADLSFNLAF